MQKKKILNDETCDVCPCRHKDICLQSAFKNGDDFGNGLRRAIAKRERENAALTGAEWRSFPGSAGAPG